METVSETSGRGDRGPSPFEVAALFDRIAAQRPRRGRPRLLSPFLEAGYRRALGRPATRRTVQNFAYFHRAWDVLGLVTLPADSPLHWLHDHDRDGRPRATKHTILAELGRIEDEDELREAAGLICAMRPRTRQAVTYIRRWRIGERRGSAPQLAAELVRVVYDYLRRYPLTEPTDVQAALAAAWDDLRADAGG